MTVSPRLRVLRIRRSANLLTAQAYEELFERQFATIVDVTFAPLEAWCETVLGPPGMAVDLDAAAARFAGAVLSQDFFCPSYECIPLAPLLLAARNRARAPARLLFIAHAAGLYALEWVLLRPLLGAGDLIIAPSDSARRTIDYLCPELAPFVRTIPHPMARLTRTGRRSRSPRIASLGRIHAEKLTHRVIEAMADLRARGTRSVHLDVGGPLNDGGWQGAHPYTLGLRERVRRLGLEDRVVFAGPVRGDLAKSAFLSGADAVVNLSVTIEESFPKTPIEALGVGVPVVGTDWSGLRDTVGPCGRLVPVTRPPDVLGVVEVEARRVAEAVESVLDAPPPPEQCMAWADRFSPAVILPRYRVALEEAAQAARSPDALPVWPAADESAAPAAGLLADAPPLQAFGWRELFELYLPVCEAVRRAWSGGSEARVPEGARVRRVLLGGVEPALKLFFAGLGAPPIATGSAWGAPGSGAPDMLDRLEHAAHRRGLLAGRAACVGELISASRLGAAALALDALARDGCQPVLVAFWRAELALASGDAPGALALSFAAARQGGELGESDWPLVRQVARAARRAAAPAAALPLLLEWLGRFPDSQESGPVWLDACVNAIRAGERPVELAERCYAHARGLLGDMPVVRKCGALVERTRLATTLIA